MNTTLINEPIPSVCVHFDYCGWSCPISWIDWCKKLWNSTLRRDLNLEKTGKQIELATESNRGTSLNLFSIAIHHPTCLNVSKSEAEPLAKLIGPCRSLCRDAADVYQQERSRNILRLVPWRFDCNQFPRPKDVDKMCIPPSHN